MGTALILAWDVLPAMLRHIVLLDITTVSLPTTISPYALVVRIVVRLAVLA
jgi:hypothetical protein